MKTGRKSLKDELKMFDRYSELTEPYFRILRKHLESGKKDDEKWAVEQLTKAYTKMIPQEVTGKDGKDLFPVPLLNNLPSVSDNSGDNSNSETPETN